MLRSLSIIIPTKDRPNDLEATVEGVFRQSLSTTHLVIVDQSQSNESQALVTKQYAEAPSPLRERLQLRYLRDPVVPGGGVARNRGMEIAEGEIWLFLDDDVTLEPNFVEELLTVYQQHPHVTGVSGIITNYERPPRAYRLWAFVFVRGPFHDERQPIYWKADRLRNAAPIAVRKLGGGLMSFRADAIRAHRFDENLTGVSDGEDVDFCAQLGPDAVLMIAPRARLAHKASPVGRTRDHWLRRFARANHYLYHRNWARGFRNGLAFVWLNVGLGLAALLACARRASLAPWRALREGTHEGTRVALPRPMTDCRAHQATTGRARFGWRL
jgi:GT2 family glycosyltransferase